MLFVYVLFNANKILGGLINLVFQVSFGILFFIFTQWKPQCDTASELVCLSFCLVLLS